MRHLFSVTKKDLVRQTFRCSGHGGQNINKVESGVRFIHKDSGAIGQSTTFKTQHQNEVEAFKRLCATKQFRLWLKLECARRMGITVRESPEEIMKRVETTIKEGLENGEIIVEEFEVNV